MRNAEGRERGDIQSTILLAIGKPVDTKGRPAKINSRLNKDSLHSWLALELFCSFHANINDFSSKFSYIYLVIYI